MHDDLPQTDPTPLVPEILLDENDDLVDRLLEYNPKFRQTLVDRLQQRSVPIKDVKKRL